MAMGPIPPVKAATGSSLWAPCPLRQRCPTLKSPLVGHLGLFYLQFMALFNTTESVLLIFGYDSLLVFWRNWPLCLECRIKRGPECLWPYDFLPYYHSGRWLGNSVEEIFLKYSPSDFFDKKSAVGQPRRGASSEEGWRQKDWEEVSKLTELQKSKGSWWPD